MLNNKSLKKLRAKLAVSEIVGAILMLGIATSCFSIIYFNVTSIPAPNPAPIVEISGKIEDNQLILTHCGGEPLDLDTDYVLNIGGKSLSFKVGDLLDYKSKEDGVWSLGEKIIYPIEYDFDYSLYPNIGINIIDEFSNSIVMTGITKITPTCDLGVKLTVDQITPKKYEYVLFNLTVINYYNINASGVLIEFLLPEGLIFISCSMSQGSFNSCDGLWNVGTLNVGCYATLSVVAQVTAVGYNKTTQFLLLLDGSASIPYVGGWQLICTALANSIDNKSCFPQDDSCELTIVQFGVNNICARVEIGPVVVNKTNVASLKTALNTLKYKQGKGYTPMANAFYLGNDIVANSKNFGGFNPNYRQVVLLVTDGNANVKSDPGSYCGIFTTQTLAKNSTYNSRNYLINNIALTEDRDEIDVIAVNPVASTDPIDEQFLNEKIVWPQPSYNGTPPPEDDLGWPPAGPGWYRKVTNWQEFADSISKFFSIIFNSIRVKVDIKSTAYLDPKIANDQSIVILKPI